MARGDDFSAAGIIGECENPPMRILRVMLVVAILIALFLAFRMLPLLAWFESFQAWVRDAGPVGYIAYVLLYAVACVLVLPVTVVSLAAGAIFGFAAGALVNLAGASLGATTAFLLARTVLRHRVERFVEDSPKFRALDRAFTREGTRVMWLVRISGFPPFTWVNYALGLTGVALAPFVVTTVVGMTPGVLALTWVGAAGVAALSGSGNRAWLVVTAIGAVIVSVYVARIAARALREAGSGPY